MRNSTVKWCGTCKSRYHCLKLGYNWRDKPYYGEEWDKMNPDNHRDPEGLKGSGCAAYVEDNPLIILVEEVSRMVYKIEGMPSAYCAISSSGKKAYFVRLRPIITCTCPGFRYHGHCKHIKAVQEYVKRTSGKSNTDRETVQNS